MAHGARQQARPPHRPQVRLYPLLIALLLLAIPAGTLHAADEQTVYKHFQTFAKGWMNDLTKISRQNSSKAEQKPAKSGGEEAKYACYGPECEIWIKKTDSPQTPYIGFIRYPEKHYLKKTPRSPQDPSSEDVLLATFPVTEIFRFTNNRWIF